MVQPPEELERQFQTYLFLKALDDTGTVIGSTRGCVEEGTSCIGPTFVRPDLQGQGIGSRLIRELEVRSPASRHEINSSIRCPENIRLYEALGCTRFRETREGDNGFVYLEKFDSGS